MPACELGWFLIPLGRATLYVFIMHVVLGLLWVMVRTRFLFRLIPT
ncbi:OpgC domain-containing protein [Arthrobacter sp. SLBN-112]|nr:OpgC domain-containing protein [Arthrobacter sp. SLBN-112]MDQ0799441.1 hypothetical protein [Arthrobacter sp. SLBN-112]